jgi:hypothetical protein
MTRCPIERPPGSPGRCALAHRRAGPSPWAPPAAVSEVMGGGAEPSHSQRPHRGSSGETPDASRPSARARLPRGRAPMGLVPSRSGGWSSSTRRTVRATRDADRAGASHANCRARATPPPCARAVRRLTLLSSGVPPCRLVAVQGERTSMVRPPSCRGTECADHAGTNERRQIDSGNAPTATSARALEGHLLLGAQPVSVPRPGAPGRSMRPTDVHRIDTMLRSPATEATVRL